MSLKYSIAAASIAMALSGCTTITDTVASIGSKTLTEQEIQDKRAQIFKMRDDALAELYAKKPGAAEELKKAIGYGVFEAEQVNVLLVLGSFGEGVMVDNHKGSATFMKVDRLGTGPGVGYKSYRQIVIFKNRALFDQFMTVGGDLNVSADAAFKVGNKGGSADGTMSFNPMMSIYQVTDQGVLLQANWGGVVYLPDPQLNEKK